MPNEYLSQLEAEQGQQSANPYLAQMEADQRTRTAALRGSLSQAVGTNSDQFAERRRVASYLGYPTAAVEALPPLQQRAKVQQFEDSTQAAPITRTKFTDVDFAKLAHDDVDNLTMLERGLRGLTGGAVEGFGMLVSGAGVGLDIVQRNLTQAAGALLPKPRAPGAPTPESLYGPTAGQDFKTAGGMVKRFARASVQVPQERQGFGDQVLAGLGQIGVQIPASMMLGPVPLYLQGLDAMNEKVGLDKASQGAKDLATLGGAAITGITEKWALDKLLGPLSVPVKNAVAASLARIGIGAASEGAQEFSEDFLQNNLRRLMTNPDAPSNVSDSTDDGTVGAAVGGIVRALVESGLHIRARGARADHVTQQANAQAAALEQITKLAQESKLAQRAPDAFQEFVRDAAQGGPLQEVYVSAQVLAQSGKVEQIAAASPAVAEQFDAALQTGGDIAIPVEEFAARIAANGLAQDILGELKTDPGGMTRKEAQAFAAGQAEQLNPDTLLRQAMDGAGRAQDGAAIEAAVLEQLNTAGRFSPAVNRVYAQLPRAFFETMADRLGVNPRDLYEHLAPRVLAEDIAGAPRLDQQQRGAFIPQEHTQDGKPVIALLKGADLSTFLHESGHYFLETYARLAQDAPALQGDMQVLLDWMGVADHATWQGMTLEQKRQHHEQFARGFEAYLAEGKAPSIGVREMFSRFRDWLAAVYRNLRGLNVELSDEVRAVMDRMLATDAQILEAQKAREMAPLFKTAEEAAAHGVDWRQYKGLDAHATGEAVAHMEARSIRDMTWAGRLRENTVRRLNRDAAELRKGMRREVEAEVQAMPIYAAARWLKRGVMQGAGGEAIKASAGHRLSMPALRQMYPTSGLDAVNWQKLGYGKFGMLAEDGMHPDQVAAMFGFRSGDALVRELLDAQPFAAVVEGMTDQRMLEQHGSMSSPEAIAKVADEAIHNDVRTRFLATELAGLQKAVGGARALAAMAKEQAARMVDNTRTRLLRPTKFAMAEARASRAAEAALRQGDVAEAIRQKRFQLIQQAATRAAYEAQAQIDKTLAFFRTVAEGSVDAVAKSRNMDLVNAARAILAEYGVGMRGKAPRAYLDAVKAYDPELFTTLEPMLQDAEQNAKPLDEMTVGELRALRDNVDSIWHLSRRVKLVEIDGKLVERAHVTDALAARLDALGVPDTVPGDLQAATEGDKRMRMFMGVRAALRRVESWANRMDAGDITGSFRRYLFTPISEAADAYRKDAGAHLRRYRDLLKAIEPTLVAGRIEAPELGKGYTFGASKGDAGMAEVLHAILHTGNESNKRKLLLGRGWAYETADGTLNTSAWDAFVARLIREGKLTKAHFEFAQGVWDLLDGIKPLAQATHRAVFGRYFDEITAQEFTNDFGTYRGGYVPAIADTFEVQDAAIHAELDAVNQGNAYMFPATARGFTKARVEYNRPLALDLRLVPQHIDKALLFAHMEPKVRDVMRTLRAKGLAGKLNRYDPVAYTDLLLPWLNRAAKQTVETPATGWGGKLADRFFRTARSRAGMAAMFANLTNAMQQITGLSLSALQVRPAHLASATARYVRAPAQMAQEVAALSPFMATRLDNEVMRMRQDIEDLLLNPGPYDSAKAWTSKHAYFLQSAFQNTVDTITWAAAYDQAVAKGLADQDAVRAANAAVRETQGSLSPEDISRFESGPAFTRLFTQFAGYFNMQANLLGTEVAKVSQDMGLRAGAGRVFYVFLLGFLVPAWISEAIVQAMRGGPDDEDQDGYLDEFLSFLIGAPLRNAAAMVPVAGQVATLAANTFNGKPYDDRMSTAPAISMIESAVQAPHSVYKTLAEDGSAKRAVRDTLTLVSMMTGIPVAALGKPLGYLADVEQGRVEPTGPLDAVRGVVSGAASPDSKR